jgi:hypothetical protein
LVLPALEDPDDEAPNDLAVQKYLAAETLVVREQPFMEELPVIIAIWTSPFLPEINLSIIIEGLSHYTGQGRDVILSYLLKLQIYRIPLSMF